MTISEVRALREQLERDIAAVEKICGRLATYKNNKHRANLYAIERMAGFSPNAAADRTEAVQRTARSARREGEEMIQWMATLAASMDDTLSNPRLKPTIT